MRKLASAVSREFRLIFRSGITIYMVIAPALLAVVFILVFGSVNKATVSFVVDSSMTPAIAARLEAVAELIPVDDYDQLRQRVGGPDSVAGIHMENGVVTLVTEGNEPAGFERSRKQLLDAALGAESISYTAEAYQAGKSMAYELSSACIMLLALFIGGATLGLGGVSERENRVIRAFLISPMTLPDYVLSKIVPAVIFEIVGVTAAALIMGEAQALVQYILLAVCSAFVCGIIAFLIITFADNQIAGAGVLKIVMPVFLVVGISAAFVPGQLLPVYYPLPMYWQYAAVRAIGAGAPTLPAYGMLLLTSLVWFALVLALFTKKLKMKVRR